MTNRTKYKITIYTIPHCPYCDTAKEWLNNKNIEYQEIVVHNSKSQRAILDPFTKYFPDDARGVPIIVVRIGDKEQYFNDENDPNFQKLFSGL